MKIGQNRQDRTIQEWITTNSPISLALFNATNDQLILVADGTYCYIQKSSNNTFQRKTYSGQKKRHLVKPFVVCATNGEIVDVNGLYPGTENDAKILNDVLENHKLNELVKKGDILLLDRSFRDSDKALKAIGIVPNIPELLDKSNNQKQLTTEQANKSRIVTKARWVVEVSNAFIKMSYKALKEVRNKSLPHTIMDYKIAAAFVNKFHSRSTVMWENTR